MMSPKDPAYPVYYFQNSVIKNEGMTIELEIASRILAGFAKIQPDESLYEAYCKCALKLAHKLIEESEK